MMINKLSMRIATYFFLFFFMTSANTLQAQLADDFELRQNLGISWDVTKRITIETRYRLSLNDNATQFNKSMFSFSGEYELLKWWKVGAEYRFYTSYEEDNHRLQLFTKLNYKFNKFNFNYRLQYQQTQEYLDGEYLQHNPPRRVFRNRFQVRYSYSKKVDFYVQAEPFVRLKNSRFNLYRVRYAIGGIYIFKKRHSFNPELFLNDEFNIKSPSDRIVLELSYTFDLTKRKKKASKQPSK